MKSVLKVLGGVFCVAALLLVSSGAGAQPAVSKEAAVKAKPQTECVRLRNLLEDMLRSHDRIKQAEARIKAAEHQVNRAWSGWWPKIAGTVEGGQEDIVRPRKSGTTSKLRNVEAITGTQLVYDFGAVNAQVSSAEALLAQEQFNLETVSQNLLYEGVNAYLQCIRSYETLRYAKQSVDSIKQLSGMEEAIVQRGAGLKYQDLQIKAQLASSMSYQVTVERELVAANNRFRSVFGFNLSGEEITTLAKPPVPHETIPSTLEEAVEIAYDNNPLLIQLDYMVKQAQSLVDQQTAAMFPVFEVVGEAKRKENDLGEDGIRMENKASLMMTYELFSGFNDLEGIRQAKQVVIENRKRILDQRRLVSENVRNAWVDLITLRKNAELYEIQGNITWEFLDLLKKKRVMGEEVQLLDILIGERDYISATSLSVTSGIDTILASYNLLYQMGKIDLGLFKRQEAMQQ